MTARQAPEGRTAIPAQVPRGIGHEPGRYALGLHFMSEKPAAPEYESADDQLAPRQEHAAVLNENRARQAVPLGRMRYVLIISLALVIAGFAILYFLLRP